MSSRNLSVSVLVLHYGLHLDDKGIVRYKGRIQNSSLNQVVKDPVLLPSEHHAVDLIISETHDRMIHSGVNTTLTALRERFWIIRGWQAVKKILRSCAKWRRVEWRPFSLPEPPELPQVKNDPRPPTFCTYRRRFYGTSVHVREGW